MIVGIDLGTTNSLVAVWKDGQAPLIENGLREVLTPSCVSLDEDGSVLVGRAAQERLQTHPERTASLFKRYMGSNKTLRLGKREFRPEDLPALGLKQLKRQREAELEMKKALEEARHSRPTESTSKPLRPIGPVPSVLDDPLMPPLPLIGCPKYELVPRSPDGAASAPRLGL